MARCLSFHQTYRCGRSGLCCTSNWPIPVEADRLARVQAAMANGLLRARTRPILADAGPPAVLSTDDGRCVFHETDAGGHRCAIQTALGHEALPLACRQFPRVSVVDPLGTSVVLSVYCPTAAAMLDTPGPVGIVDEPSAFPAAGEYVGLDARTSWPPILRPGVLMDWPSWRAFERFAVDLIANRSASPTDALGRIRFAAEAIRSWTPGAEPLHEQVDRVFAVAASRPVDNAPMATDERARLLAEVHDAIPADLKPADLPVRPARESSTRHLRFLANHAFANWAICLGDDLRAWLREIERAHALIEAGFSVGEADLRMRHLRVGAGV